MTIPSDYEERVYAGVLGKIIGVYLGRPFEGWWYDRLTERFGEVNYYVHEELGARLVVTDDDITGSFTFLRALNDHGIRRDLTAEEIGRTWLNYLIENRTILWWGGMGMSTEHTAYLRLKAGIPAPQSGSIEQNGATVAEQIGAQIFIDGWGMIAPGDPGLAADLAGKAASVSHDGEARYGAQVIAAMEAAAFVESDLDRLIDTGLSFIPKDSTIAALIRDLREWRSQDDDWRAARSKLDSRYGYHRFGGACHMVPNHGVIMLALLYGDDSFQKSLMIANTAGWDTDCNSGNVGCLMGLKNGLAAIDAGPDWRGPVADRMYLPTADGGRCVTDAAFEALQIAALGRRLYGDTSAAPPKDGARYHFTLPGSVQGFRVENSTECRGTAKLENPGNALAVEFRGVAPARSCRVSTATFVPPEDREMGGYSLIASPRLYPGQTVRAEVRADAVAGEVTVGLYGRYYGAEDRSAIQRGPAIPLKSADWQKLEWRVEPVGGSPLFEVGVELRSPSRADGRLLLNWLHWDGQPDVVFEKPAAGGMWHRAWVNGVTHFHPGDAKRPLRIMQDEGIGIVSQGTREWKDYVVSASVEPRLAGRTGLAARVQGQKRFAALVFAPQQKLQLIQWMDIEEVLSECSFEWQLDQGYECSIAVRGDQITARVEGGPTLRGILNHQLDGGAAGIFCEAGRVDVGPVRITPCH